MLEALKNLATKGQVKTALNLGDKNKREFKISSDVLFRFISLLNITFIRSQKYLIFQPVFIYSKRFTGAIDKIFPWKFKLLLEESNTTPCT